MDDPLAAPPLVVLVGPTAVGKSDISVALAESLDAEIVNADSMQLYRGMDIGTAKLPLNQRNGIEHHLLDIWDIDVEANVSEYQRIAREKIEDVRSRGKSALLVGGSGLYVNAVIDNLSFPGTDLAIRARLEKELEEVGALNLFKRLEEVSPATARGIEPMNARRVVRALEVAELTGSNFNSKLPRESRYLDCTVIGLDRQRSQLDDRIARRVEAIWELGLLSEVETLLSKGLADAPTARKALGYPQAVAQISGALSEAEAIEQTRVSTRRFARRQLSWFRRDSAMHWVELEGSDIQMQEIVPKLMKIITKD